MGVNIIRSDHKRPRWTEPGDTSLTRFHLARLPCCLLGARLERSLGFLFDESLNVGDVKQGLQFPGFKHSVFPCSIVFTEDISDADWRHVRLRVLSESSRIQLSLEAEHFRSLI